MNLTNPKDDIFLKRTRTAFLCTRLLSAPFWALFCMLPFILYKDLHATPLQVTIIIALKPIVSIFSTYWSALIKKRRDRLLSNVIWAGVLGHLPFFFFPFIENPWFFIFSSGFYMMLAQKGVIPAWMEIFKLNIPGDWRGRIFAYGTTVGYIGDALLPFILGWLLDGYFQAWRWIFPFASMVSLTAIFFQARIPIHLDKNACSTSVSPTSLSFLKQVIQPWKNAWEVLHNRPDFARFQVGYLFGGGGLMIMQPALPGFFIDTLNISYTELAIALTLCKGIGFASTSSFWAAWMTKIDIYRFCSWVTLLAVIFPICLIAAHFHLIWLYIAYISWGVMQAGSELSWNMSGPIFAKEEDSSVFSSVNVLTVGLRGCIFPFLGSFLCLTSGSTFVIALGGLMCLMSTYRMLIYSNRYQTVNTEFVSETNV